jgi:ribonuclease HII
MVFVLGTDEAGYGPNLGPLCIAASAWQLPDDAPSDGLYDRLAHVVAAQLEEGCPKLRIADSKALYKAGGTLELLERGVLVALACLDRLPHRWRDIWSALDTESVGQIDGQPWHDGFDEPLPLCATRDELLAAAQTLLAGCQSALVRFVELQSAILFPAAFNHAVKGCDNKAEVLSLTTFHLARRILERLPAGRAIVFCDKHGGRTYYAALLQHVFPDELVIVKLETAKLAIYAVKHSGRQIEFRFQPKGERHLPTALASMTAKYLRELAMRPFNAFWQRHIPDLKATAGYPTDARRFFDDIRPVRRKLKIANDLVWRKR